MPKLDSQPTTTQILLETACAEAIAVFCRVSLDEVRFLFRTYSAPEAASGQCTYKTSTLRGGAGVWDEASPCREPGTVCNLADAHDADTPGALYCLRHHLKREEERSEATCPRVPTSATRYSVLATALVLCLTFALVPRATAQSIKACGDIMADGQTFQQKADAVLTGGANDPRMETIHRNHLVFAQEQFDNLCLIDAELGTREAGNFFNEEAERISRLSAATRAKAVRP